MLAMDVSLSMRVNDVKPTRMEAAQGAARTFLHELPRNIEVGIVTFAGSAQVAQQAGDKKGRTPVGALQVGLLRSIELPRSELAENDVRIFGACQNAVANDLTSGSNERQSSRVAIVNIRGTDSRQRRIFGKWLEKGRDVFCFLHRNLEGEQGIRIVLVYRDGQ
jgi:hypothetical protein